MSEQSPTADLTAILTDHQPRWEVDGDFGEMQWVECDGPECEWIEPEDSTNGLAAHAQHVADVLTAAGFGNVQAVLAQYEGLRDERDALRERITALDRSGRMSFDHSDLRALLDASPDREDGAS